MMRDDDARASIRLGEFDAPEPVPFWDAALTPPARSGALTIGYVGPGAATGIDPGIDAAIRRAIGRVCRLPPTQADVLESSADSASIRAMLHRAHIVVATQGANRLSCEALAVGCVVVLVTDAPGDAPGEPPVLTTRPGSIDAVLATLAELGPALLAELGAEGRRWMERQWDFARQWATAWLPAVEQAERAAHPPGP